MIRVQWRETGEYLVGYVEGPGFLWTHVKSCAMRFATVKQFREFESGAPLVGSWCAKTQIRFRKARA